MPPIRTGHCWEAQWHGRYHAGVMLLDIEDPRKLIAASSAPLLTPETDFEHSGGYRNDVVFATATLLKDDGTLVISYGAADTHVCIATAPLDAVIDFCFTR